MALFFSISPFTTQCTPNIGSVPIRDSRVFNKPLGRSLHSFTSTAHSAHLLSSIRLASSTGWLTHFDHSLCSLCSLTSLPHGMVEIHKCPDLHLNPASQASNLASQASNLEQDCGNHVFSITRFDGLQTFFFEKVGKKVTIILQLLPKTHLH